MNVIEVMKVKPGHNVSGLDTSTPWTAEALLDCGHQTNVHGCTKPAYRADLAREDGCFSLVGNEHQCQHPSHSAEKREWLAVAGGLGVRSAIDSIRSAQRIWALSDKDVADERYFENSVAFPMERG